MDYHIIPTSWITIHDVDEDCDYHLTEIHDIHTLAVFSCVFQLQKKKIALDKRSRRTRQYKKQQNLAIKYSEKFIDFTF